jgi:hypothetical protein
MHSSWTVEFVRKEISHILVRPGPKNSKERCYFSKTVHRCTGARFQDSGWRRLGFGINIKGEYVTDLRSADTNGGLKYDAR